MATAYKPAKFDEIPEGLKDPDGKWFAIHYGSLGFFVNVDALGGADVPQCFADLTKPEYRGMVGYLDPSSAFVGYAGAVAINMAFGGDLDNFDPAIKYFNDLAENSPIVPKQTSYARVVSGEIRSSSIMISTPIAASMKKMETLNLCCPAKVQSAFLML